MATFEGYEHNPHMPPRKPSAVQRHFNAQQERLSFASRERRRQGRAKSAIRKVVDSMWFRTFVVVVITASTIATAVDGPFIKAEYGMARSERGLRLANSAFGAAFWMEMILKLCAYGPRGYAASVLNLFDAFTNLIFLAEVVVRALELNPGWIAQLKVFRMVRVFKLAATTPSFRSLAGKMGNSVSAVQSMLVVLLILIFFVATTALHIYHNMYDALYGGASCRGYGMGANSTELHSEACLFKPRHHFDNIWIAYATVFQVMTTDDWVSVMYDTYDASGNLAFFLFPLIIVVGNFVVLNIFLAILLSTFSAASKREAKAKAEADEADALAIQEAAKAAEKITANADLLKESALLRGALSRKGSYASGRHCRAARRRPRLAQRQGLDRRRRRRRRRFLRVVVPVAHAQARADQRLPAARGGAAHAGHPLWDLRGAVVRVGGAARRGAPAQGRRRIARPRRHLQRDGGARGVGGAGPRPRHDAARDQGLPRVRRGPERRDRRRGAAQGAA